MNKDIKVKLIPLSKANRAVDKIVDISTGEQVPNKENTLIYVDKDNTPVNKDYLENNNYTYIDDAGDFHSIKPLQEVIVSPKSTVSDILQKFVNDEILLNKDNIRVNNMRKLLSTDSGRDIQKSFSEGRNLLGLYLFSEDPIIGNSAWFKKVLKSFTPTKGSFSFDKRYSELYPGLESGRYEMQTVVPRKTSIRFNDALNQYAPIGKTVGKEGSMVINMGDKYQAINIPGSNPVGPIDDVGGHLIKLDYDKKGRLYQTTQDLWKFNPRDYSLRYPDNGIRVEKQAALMDKVGFPFILQTTNPVKIDNSRIWKSIPDYVLKGRTPRVQRAYITFNTGGKFSFKENSLIKNAKEKRDMRKKLIKSDRPTYNTKFIKKAQQGSSINYVTYTKLAPEVVDYETIDIPELEEDNINDVFSPYSYLKSHIPVEEDIEEDIEDPIEDTKTTNWIPKSREDYINIMGKALRNALNNNNINPEIWTNYLLAQTALESNWGKSSISTKYNNYGGIKGTGSGSVSTREYNPQRGYYSTHSSFKSFNSVEDFADYFVKILRDKFKAFSTTPEEYLKNIRNHGYFTAPLNDYSRIFNSILNSISIKAQEGYKLNYVTYTPIPIKDISYPDILDIPEPNKPIVSNDLEYSDTSSENYLEDDTEEYDISKSIEDLFKDAGIDIEITSSYRPGATTKSGRTSWHSVKDKYGNSRAYDIKPVNGDFQALKNAMINNPLIRYYFSKRGLGVLDETTPDMMARTGATGKHFHIGPDKLAIQTWNEWIS